MSEQTIRNKLIGAYARAGRLLGRDFDLYRPPALDGALSQENWLRTQPVAFTVSNDFVTAQGEGFVEYKVFTDHSDVLAGDIFNDATETFVIVWNRGLETVLAFKATDIVQVLRTSWATTGGLQAQRQVIASSVPASVVRKESTTDIAITGVQQTSQAKRWEVRIRANPADILQTDNIKFSNGTLLHVDTIKVTEFNLVLTCSEVEGS